MSAYDDILSAFGEVDQHLEGKAEECVQNNDASGLDKWVELWGKNEYAYFVLLFATFEDRANEWSCLLIETLRRGAWPGNSPWDVFEFEKHSLASGTRKVARIPFKARLALLLDKGRSEYQKVTQHYDTRCSLAHGNYAAVGTVTLEQVARDLNEAETLMRSHLASLSIPPS